MIEARCRGTQGPMGGDQPIRWIEAGQAHTLGDKRIFWPCCTAATPALKLPIPTERTAWSCVWMRCSCQGLSRWCGEKNGRKTGNARNLTSFALEIFALAGIGTRT